MCNIQTGMSNTSCSDLDSVKSKIKTATLKSDTRLPIWGYSNQTWLPQYHHPEKGKAKQAMSTNKRREVKEHTPNITTTITDVRVHASTRAHTRVRARAAAAAQACLFSGLLLNISATLVRNFLTHTLSRDVRTCESHRSKYTIQFHFVSSLNYRIPFPELFYPEGSTMTRATFSTFILTDITDTRAKLCVQRHLFCLAYGWLCWITVRASAWSQRACWLCSTHEQKQWGLWDTLG